MHSSNFRDLRLRIFIFKWDFSSFKFTKMAFRSSYVFQSQGSDIIQNPQIGSHIPFLPVQLCGDATWSELVVLQMQGLLHMCMCDWVTDWRSGSLLALVFVQDKQQQHSFSPNQKKWHKNALSWNCQQFFKPPPKDDSRRTTSIRIHIPDAVASSPPE